MVEKSTMDRDAVVSSDDFQALTVLINTVTGVVISVQTALDDIETALTDILTAISNADIATTNATNASTLAKTKAGLANTAATNANTAKDSSIIATNKVPATQLPAIASAASDITYDHTISGWSATNAKTAIDELDAIIGNLALLTTTSNTDLVGAVNEVKASNDTNKSDIGNKTTLNTTEKSNIVDAINENVINISNINTSILEADIVTSNILP